MPSSDHIETQSNTGVKEGCMKFYAFNDDGGDTVNLILDHNATKSVEWELSGSNANGPIEVLTNLNSDTSSWQGTITPSNYTMDQSLQESNAQYTIYYSGCKARLITAQEIAQITGNTTWNEKVATNGDWYYFDSKTTTESDTCKKGDTNGCKYGWLYDRTSTDCKTYGCLNNSDRAITGYWTASSVANDANYAWLVTYEADMNSGNVDGGTFGVRPVIEVLKSNLE